MERKMENFDSSIMLQHYHWFLVVYWNQSCAGDCIHLTLTLKQCRGINIPLAITLFEGNRIEKHSSKV